MGLGPIRLSTGALHEVSGAPRLSSRPVSRRFLAVFVGEAQTDGARIPGFAISLAVFAKKLDNLIFRVIQLQPAALAWPWYAANGQDIQELERQLPR